MKNTTISPFFLTYLPIAIFEDVNLQFGFSSINKSNEKLHIFVSLFVKSQPATTEPVKLGEFNPGEAFSFNQTEILRYFNLNPEMLKADGKLIIAHVVPDFLLKKKISFLSKIEISSEKFLYYYGLADIFLEYKNSSGTPIMSVGAGGPPTWNNLSIKPQQSTIVQGAKCIISSQHESYILYINGSSELSFNKTANITTKLFDESGTQLWRLQSSIPPFSYSLIKLQAPRTTELKFYNIIGSCDNSTLFPFVIVKNTKTGGMFIEHGMPPLAYANEFNSEQKLQAALRLAQ